METPKRPDPDFQGQPSRKKYHRDFNVSSNRDETLPDNRSSLEGMQSHSSDTAHDVEMAPQHNSSGGYDHDVNMASQHDDIPEDPTENMFADHVLRMKIPIQNLEIDRGEGEKRSKKALKKEMKAEFFSKVILLRNSGGGVLIIRNQNYRGIDEKNDSRYRDNFNDMVEDELQALGTCKGEVGEYESWYQSVWWKGVGKWLLYYIKDGLQLTFPLSSKVHTAHQQNLKEVRTEEVCRRLLQSRRTPPDYQPTVKHAHSNKKNGDLRLEMKCPHLHESTNIQLKACNDSNEKDNEAINDICKDTRHYFSAFSQNEIGGSIYFGIEEGKNFIKGAKLTTQSKTPVVCGIKFDIDNDKEQMLIQKLRREICEEMLWLRHSGEKAHPDEIRNYFEICFHNLDPEKKPSCTRKVLEVSVAKFYGCVCSSDPKPPYLDAEGKMKHFTIEEWVPMVVRGHQAEVLNDDKLGVTDRCQRIDLGTRNNIYEVANSSERIQQTVFKTEKGLRFTPEALLSKLNTQYGYTFKQFTDTLQRVFDEDEGVVIVENFASIVKEKPNCLKSCPENLLSDFFVLTEKRMPVFVSLVEVAEELEDPVHDELHVYNRETSKLIKVNLSKYCRSFVTILFGIVNVHQTCNKSIQQQIQKIISQKSRYPDYLVNMIPSKLSEYLRSLTVMASVIPSPLHNRIGTSLLNIATETQFDLIWNEPYRNRHLLIKGFPGTGKTIMAHQLIRRLSNKGARTEEILFVTPHRTSCFQAIKMDCSVALTSACLESDMMSSTRRAMYDNIKHIVVDDAQLICAMSKNNDWFDFLDDLWEKKKRSCKDSIFWMFYGEHNYQMNGGGNINVILENFDQERELNSIIRNSHSIARFAAQYSQDQDYHTAVENIKSVHNFEGQEVVVKKVRLNNEDQYFQAVGSFLNTVLKEGYNLEDVAVLFSREKDIPMELSCIGLNQEKVEKSNQTLKREIFTTCKPVQLPEVGNVGICSAANNDMTRHVVVDTIRRYSGLDRPVVLALNPVVQANDIFTGIDGLQLIIATRPIAKLELWLKNRK